MSNNSLKILSAYHQTYIMPNSHKSPGNNILLYSLKDKKTEAQKCSDLSQVTQLECAKTRT